MPTKRSLVIALAAAWLLLLCSCTNYFLAPKQEDESGDISATVEGAAPVLNGWDDTGFGVFYGSADPAVIADSSNEDPAIGRPGDNPIRPDKNNQQTVEKVEGKTTFDLDLDGGGVFTLPLDGFDDPGLVSARPASDGEAEELLAAGDFDLVIPGIIIRSDIITRSDIIIRSDLIALGLIDFGGQDAALSGKDLVFALPASALPAQGLPLSARPASALPASSIPSNIIPSNAIASTALPSSALPSSALPSSALPAQALPSSYYLVQAEEDLVVEAMAYFVGDDGSRGATRCDSAGDVSRSNVDGLHFTCKVEDDLPPGKVTLMVFATTMANYYEAKLDDLPVALCPRGLKVRPNTAPRITTNGAYRIEVGTTSYIFITAEDDEDDVLTAEVSGLPSFATRDYAVIAFNPTAALEGTTTSFTITVSDINDPPLSASKTVRIEIGEQLVGGPETTIVSGPATLTNQTVASFSFTSDDPAATFECDLDGNGWLDCTSPASYPGLAGGSHTFQIRAVDDAGNPDLTPALSTWTVDTVAPTGAGIAFVNGSSGSTLTQAVTLTAGDNIGVTAYCKKETSSNPTLTDTCWTTITTTPSLSSQIDHTFADFGSKTIYAWFKDGAGNISARASDTITLADPGAGANPLVAIVGGTFQMGQDNIATPVHQVTVSAFRLHKYEVTAAEYKACVDATVCGYYGETSGTYYTYNRTGYEDHPINYVNWSEARTYCQWLGGDLPTEAQWEFAARGTTGRTYPWGNDAPSSSNTDKANCSQSYCYDGYQYTAPVGSFPNGATPDGFDDLAVNIWEWTLDWYGSYSSSTEVDPTGPASGSNRVLRGGSWFYSAEGIRSAFRGNNYPVYRIDSIGFRCASPAQD